MTPHVDEIFRSGDYVARGAPPPLATPFSSLDGSDAAFKRLFQEALADGPDHQTEDPPLEVLAFAYHDHVDAGRAVGAAA